MIDWTSQIEVYWFKESVWYNAVSSVKRGRTRQNSFRIPMAVIFFVNGVFLRLPGGLPSKELLSRTVSTPSVITSQSRNAMARRVAAQSYIFDSN